jgi:glutamate formiminotransferase/glutamate formiminotransferase/formiminotetrahydrofolate cyclodeaminase
MSSSRIELRRLSLTEFLDAVSAAAPMPAGGCVAAFVGALAASLGAMGARAGHQADAHHRLGELSRRLHQLVQDDADAYQALSEARRFAKERTNPSPELSNALHDATLIPLEIAELACEVGFTVHACLPSVIPPVRSDLMVGMIMAIAGAEAGLQIVGANMNIQPNPQLKDRLAPRIEKVTQSLEELRTLC